MSKQFFLNLPIKDLTRSVDFFTALGFTFNPQFTDEKATSMIINDSCFVMLLTEPFFQSFTPKPIADPTKVTGALMCFSANSRQEVDEIVEKAVAAGGSIYAEPKDHGFMYQHSFSDPDGHQWEIAWMDPAAMQG
jgi:predicted lactoylglutathione lyase